LEDKIAQLAHCETSSKKEALNIIRDFAEDICTTVPLEQSSHELQLSGDVQIKLKGVVGKIADLGVKGGGTYRDDTSRGVLQSELAKAIHDSDNCRLAVARKLIDKLMPAAVDPPTTSPDLTTEDRVNRKDNTRVIPTGEKVKEGGIFYIDLQAAAGAITKVDYKCVGGVCNFVYVCPDGGNCENRLRDFDISGRNARFWAWSNSADNGVFVFTIHYRQ
jgi:hypothetical protein